MTDDPLATIQNSRYFDEDWYCETYPDAGSGGLSAAGHYLRHGYRLGHDPSPDFSTKAYLQVYRDVAERGENPLWHYETRGRGEGRQPNPRDPGTPPAIVPGQTRIDVVVPVYNALDDVKACLQALTESATETPLRIILVNDGSDASTTDWLRTASRSLASGRLEIELIEQPSNQGYTRTVNTGLRAADAPAVVLLNSDTIVTPGWIDGLLRCLLSAPAIGIVGPLSNAATWQNVPDLRDDDGKFAINDLPPGTDPDGMAHLVQRTSRRAYPRATYVNGFCFMIARAVIDRIGLMDQTAFPVGYGEENDFCIRAADAGFDLAIADDVYVYHAKSKSFGEERRLRLIADGNEALVAKYTRERYAALREQAHQTDEMNVVRARIQAAIAKKVDIKPMERGGRIGRRSMLFALPEPASDHNAGSVVQAALSLRAAGADARVAVRQADLADYTRLFDDVADAGAFFAPYPEGGFADCAAFADIAIATGTASVPLVAAAVGARPWVLPAYYLPDHEPLRLKRGDGARNKARASYIAIPGAVLFAESHWLCQTVATHNPVTVHKVDPGLDPAVFSPDGPARARPSGKTTLTALVRPDILTAAATRVAQVLSKLHASLGERVALRIVGCENPAQDITGVSLDFPFECLGTLTRAETAAVLRGSDLFLDLSDNHAFWRMGLEAMACGAVPVLPRQGGVAEYAVDRVNALVTDPADVDSAAARIIGLLDAPGDVARLRDAAIAMAATFTSERAGNSILDVLAPAFEAYRAAHPKPRDTSGQDVA